VARAVALRDTLEAAPNSWSGAIKCRCATSDIDTCQVALLPLHRRKHLTRVRTCPASDAANHKPRTQWICRSDPIHKRCSKQWYMTCSSQSPLSWERAPSIPRAGDRAGASVRRSAVADGRSRPDRRRRLAFTTFSSASTRAALVASSSGFTRAPRRKAIRRGVGEKLSTSLGGRFSASVMATLAARLAQPEVSKESIIVANY
jgi:hypothetical protein